MHTAVDLMHRNVITVSPQTPAQQAIDLLVANNLSGLPVVDNNGAVVGIFSVVDQLLCGRLNGTVQQMMSTKVVTVNSNTSVVDVAQVFKDRLVRRLPVTQDGVLVGIIGLRDLIRYIGETERTLGLIAPVVQNCAAEYDKHNEYTAECYCNAD